MYNTSLKGYYDNGKANLREVTKDFFEDGLEDDELLQSLLKFTQTYANSYNSDIIWEFFMYRGTESDPRIWCLNCFQFSDVHSDQNVVFFHYN
jgi:hypothetical protein